MADIGGLERMIEAAASPQWREAGIHLVLAGDGPAHVQLIGRPHQREFRHRGHWPAAHLKTARHRWDRGCSAPVEKRIRPGNRAVVHHVIANVQPAGLSATDERAQGRVTAIGAGMNQWEMEEDFANNATIDVFLLAGRYSEWEYYNSDHAFVAGRKAAEAALGLNANPAPPAVAVAA